MSWTYLGGDPFRTLLIIVGVPFSLWYFIGTPGAGLRLTIALALVWTGFGFALILLSRSRS